MGDNRLECLFYNVSDMNKEIFNQIYYVSAIIVRLLIILSFAYIFWTYIFCIISRKRFGYLDCCTGTGLRRRQIRAFLVRHHSRNRLNPFDRFLLFDDSAGTVVAIPNPVALNGNIVHWVIYWCGQYYFL